MTRAPAAHAAAANGRGALDQADLDVSPARDEHEPTLEAAFGHSADPSLAYLLGRLAIIEARVRKAVDRRRADDPDPGDRFRGLYISDAQVDGILTNPGAALIDDPWTAAAVDALAALDRAADASEAAGQDIRLRRLARAFHLEPDDIELLLVALAPDLDPRFERLYGYLHDDVSRRRASAGLALELAGSGSGVAAVADVSAS